jgi:hypothetical protein
LEWIRQTPLSHLWLGSSCSASMPWIRVGRRRGSGGSHHAMDLHGEGLVQHHHGMDLRREEDGRRRWRPCRRWAALSLDHVESDLTRCHGPEWGRKGRSCEREDLASPSPWTRGGGGGGGDLACAGSAPAPSSERREREEMRGWGEESGSGERIRCAEFFTSSAPVSLPLAPLLLPPSLTRGPC